MDIKNGVAKDPRPQEAKEKDYPHIAGANPVVWVEKTEFKRYKQRNQWSSYSCVFQSGAKAIEILLGKVVSATPYFWRKNYPEKGAWIQDAADIFYNRFSCSEEASPSQNQNEVEMNKIKPLTTNLGITGYRTIYEPKDIEKIAEAIASYGQCLITVGSNSYEYKQTPFYSGKTIDFYHCVCGVDYAKINGVKSIICEDSAGQNSSPDGLRILTEDFIQKRGTGALYFLGAKDVSVPQDKPIPDTPERLTLFKKIYELLAKLLSK